MNIETKLKKYEEFYLPVDTEVMMRDNHPVLTITTKGKDIKELLYSGIDAKELRSHYHIHITPGGGLRLAEGESQSKQFALINTGDTLIGSEEFYPLEFELDLGKASHGYMELEIFRGADRVGYYAAVINRFE